MTVKYGRAESTLLEIAYDSFYVTNISQGLGHIHSPIIQPVRINSLERIKKIELHHGKTSFALSGIHLHLLTIKRNR
jgi:hypothetical protein